MMRETPPPGDPMAVAFSRVCAARWFLAGGWSHWFWCCYVEMHQRQIDLLRVEGVWGQYLLAGFEVARAW